MIEVEVKLPVTDSDKIKKILLEEGFKESGFIEEHDTYFDNHQGGIRANDEALRVRETKDYLSGQVRAQINFKGRKLDTCTMTREELETEVENGEICRKILQVIGYNPVNPDVIKERIILRKGRVTACLDKVRGLGEFLELEIMTDSEQEKDAALGQIEKILDSLGHRISDTVRTSYLSMLQKEKNPNL